MVTESNYRIKTNEEQGATQRLKIYGKVITVLLAVLTGIFYVLIAEAESIIDRNNVAWEQQSPDIWTDIFNESVKSEISLRSFEQKKDKIIITARAGSNKDIKAYLESLAKLDYRGIKLIISSIKKKGAKEFAFEIINKKITKKGMNNKRILKNIEVPSSLRKVSDVLKDSGLDISRFSPRDEVKSSSFTMIPVEIKVEGRLQDFLRVTDKIKFMDFLANLQDVQATLQDNATGKITFRTVLFVQQK